MIDRDHATRVIARRCLRVVEGPDAGAAFDLPAQGALVVGRGVGSELLIADPDVSRRHARIGRDSAGGLVIEDLGSANGTFVGGTRIDAPRSIVAGDRITVGSTALIVEDPVPARPGAAPGPPPPPGSPPPSADPPPRADPPPPPSPAAAPQTPAPAASVGEAWALYKAGCKEDSRAVFQRLAARNVADGFYGLGYLALESNDVDGAQTAFESAVRADPRHANAHYRLGAIAEMRGDAAAARQRYAAALAIKPDHVSAKARIVELDPRQHPARSRPSAPAAPAPLARQPTGKGTVGRIVGVQQRQEQDYWTRRSSVVLNFRLATEDADGNPLPPVPVEMKGPRLRGSLQPGDVAELPRSWRPGRKPKALHNLTTGETVTLTSSSRQVGTTLYAIFMIFWVAVIVAFVIAGLSLLDSAP